jgi:hypothetical protein
VTGRTVDLPFAVVVVPREWAKQVTRDLAVIKARLGIVIENEETIMDEQQHVDAEVEAIGVVVTDLAAAATNIEAEIAALKTGNPAVDFSGLDAAVASLQGAQASVDALETPAEVAPVSDVPADAPAEAAPVE